MSIGRHIAQPRGSQSPVGALPFVIFSTHLSDCSDADAVAAVLLVPVRAAMHGSFPLAGTYFQACMLRLRLRTIHMHADSAEELSCAVPEPTQSWTCSAFSMQINELFLAHDTVAQPVQVWGAAVENLQVKQLRSSRQNVTC